MTRLMTSQKKEIEHAVIGMGEYRIQPEFSNLGVDSQKFFQMSQQLEKALKKLFNANFNDKSTADSESGNSDDNVQMGDQTNPLLNVAVPQYVAEKVWIDSQHLVSTESNVCAYPGCTDGNCFLVKGTIATRQRPYFVECKKNGQISCEQSCMLYHSSGVCAHTVAVAQKKGCLDVLLKWLNKRDKLSVTKMANVGLPIGAGKKPHSRRKYSIAVGYTAHLSVNCLHNSCCAAYSYSRDWSVSCVSSMPPFL